MKHHNYSSIGMMIAEHP